jgi:class 3 adenylate cyclase
MQQVAEWLEKHGLGQYAQRFAENDISFSVLPDLTDQHLKEIGVSLGHRLQLLRAIAELTSHDKEAPKLAVITGASAALQDTAERRQVAVMFTDLVGSTALSARMDPEDLREVISAYQKCMAETVSRFGGFVAKYMGDGVLVYFGYPHAHEDDAELAVRAGLELVAAVGALKTHAPPQTRVGIATGLVVHPELLARHRTEAGLDEQANDSRDARATGSTCRNRMCFGSYRPLMYCSAKAGRRIPLSSSAVRSSFPKAREGS